MVADSLPISGQIDPKSFPYLLVDLYRQGATGSLKVDGANHQKALYFRAGKVLFASSNDPKDQLGAILVESGKITEAQLDDVNQKVGQGNPLAKALSDSGVVSQRELSDAARAKVERILSDVISYDEGSFEFEDGVLPKGAVDLKLAPERLFIAAVRRVADRAFVLRHLDGLNVVLSPKPELRERLSEIESEVGGLPDHLDGMATLKDVASRIAVDEFDAAKIACGLLFLGLIEKGATAESAEASPFFMPAEEGGELDLSGGGAPQFGGLEADASPSISFDDPQPSVSFAPEPETVEPSELLSPPQPAFASKSDETLVMGDLPSFSFAELSAPAKEPTPEPPPPPPPTQVGGGTGPLKIIPPPKAAERTRPPQRPSKDDLAALDELLGKKSPEGPLTPIAKPADEWKPQFLPAKETSRGKKRSSDGGKFLLMGGAALVVALLLGGGYYYWTTMAAAPVKVAAQPSPTATTLAPARTLAGAPSTEPPAASAAPTTTAPAATPTPAPPTTLAAKPTPPAATTPEKPPVTTTPAKPTAATAKPAVPPGGLGHARALLRKGQFPEAANAFLAGLKAGKDPYALQILVACSADTLEKANVATAADDLFIVPVHYKGKDCYRVGWGVYDTEAKANAGARSVPAYFKEGGAKPKVVTITEITK